MGPSCDDVSPNVMQPLESVSPVILNPHLNPKKPVPIELLNKVGLLQGCVLCSLMHCIYGHVLSSPYLVLKMGQDCVLCPTVTLLHLWTCIVLSLLALRRG